MKSQSQRNPIRIGQIDFVNVWPFFHQLHRALHTPNYEFIRGVPAQLNRLMESEQIDIAPVSSIAFAKNRKDWYVIADVSISAQAEVRSILLLHKEPLENWRNVKIALTSSSETSVCLLKWLVAKLPDVHVEYITMNPDCDAMLADADAALLIGDDALRYLITPRLGILITDLGAWWNQQTNGSMTYALWVVRKEVYNQRQSEIEEVIRILQDAVCHSWSELEEGVKQAQALMGGSDSFWLEYFNGLSYRLSKQEMAGLMRFYQAASSLNEMDPINELKDDSDILKIRVDA